jgi:hypothetical protein
MSSTIGDGAFNSALTDGLAQISGSASIPFVQYIRYVLPLDGYVFWLATQQTTFTGSLHYAATDQQNQDDNFAVNRVVFTATEEIQSFNEINPSTMWVGQWDGMRFAFSSRGYFAPNAGLFHYAGDAVYPTLATQLLDVGNQPDPDTVIVSNSLPAWLSIQGYTPEWLNPLNPGVTLYPSFLVPDNLEPPYGSVHIEPASTTALQSVPLLGPTASGTQLATDRVRVTLYGLTNVQALDWLQTALRYMEDTSVIGLMNMPIMRDEKRTQVELGALAMKKSIEFDVSYNQSAVRDTARQMIKTVANIVVTPNWHPPLQHVVQPLIFPA